MIVVPDGVQHIELHPWLVIQLLRLGAARRARAARWTARWRAWWWDA